MKQIASQFPSSFTRSSHFITTTNPSPIMSSKTQSVQTFGKKKVCYIYFIKRAALADAVMLVLSIQQSKCSIDYSAVALHACC